MLKSFCLAFSMYSKIPMPRVEWEEKNMKYVLCFFPLIGIVQGVAMYLLWLLRGKIGVFIPFEVFALAGCVVPVLVTGGIHLDGFMDTMDALHSWQDKQRKLEILKDPHVGAFSCIALACYFCLYGAGLFLIAEKRQLLFLMVGFCLARVFSAFAIVFIKSAKKDGLLYTFASSAHRWMAISVLTLWLAGMLMVTELLYNLWGCIMIGCSLLVFGYYIYMSQSKFGGLTGDLAGWFVAVYELVFVWIAGSMEFICCWL